MKSNRDQYQIFGLIQSIAVILMCLFALAVMLSGCATVKKNIHKEVEKTDSTATETSKATTAVKTTSKTVEVVKEKSTITVPGLDTASKQLLQVGVPNIITTPQGSFSAFVQDGKIELSVIIPPKIETTEHEITREITGSTDATTQEDDTREARVAKVRSTLEKSITKTPTHWWANWWIWIILIIVGTAIVYMYKKFPL